MFTRQAHDTAETLLKAVADLGMDMALAKRTPTHRHNVTKKWTRLDQVFISEHLLEAVIICDTLPEEHRVNMDHIPIVTVIDVELTKAPAQVTRNFRDVDWEKFRNMLEDKLVALGPPKHIKTPDTLNRTCDKLTCAL
jgi:hypothetical protein